jgi:hypothetical protein
MVANPTLRVVCIREVQRSLRESAYRLIGDKISALGVGAQFEVRHDRIETAQGRLHHVCWYAGPYLGVDKVFGINYLRMGRGSANAIREIAWSYCDRQSAPPALKSGSAGTLAAVRMRLISSCAAMMCQKTRRWYRSTTIQTRGFRKSLRPSGCLITVCAPIGIATSG